MPRDDDATTPTETEGALRPTDNGFIPMAPALADQPFGELPQKIQDQLRRCSQLGDSLAHAKWIGDPCPPGTGTLWGAMTPDEQLARVNQLNWEHDPANEDIREKLWELQQAITRKLTQLDDEIDLLENTPTTLVFDSDTRESKLIRTYLKRKTLKDDEAELLAAGWTELHSVVSRLMEAHPDLVSSPGSGGGPMPVLPGVTLPMVSPGAPAKRQRGGRQNIAGNAAQALMRAALDRGEITREELDGLRIKQLLHRFPVPSPDAPDRLVSRPTITDAPNAVLDEPP
jgi:hypothetical protein